MTLNTEHDRLKNLFEQLKEDKKISRSAFNRAFPIKGGDSMIMQHISGYRPINLESGLTYVRGFNHYGLNVTLADISSRLVEESEKKIDLLMRSTASYVVSEDESEEGSFNKIKFIEAKGSCGGGSFNFDVEENKHLIKENSFFSRFNVKPENLIAIYADGDSMADFIIHGDIVIFDTSKKDIINERIYLIQHPAGLRIKKITVNIKGEVVLKSFNRDKYPDEVVDPNSSESLKVLGQFIYRQGGW